MSLQVPQEIQQRLGLHLEWMKIEPALVLDLGYGAGLAQPLLQQRYPRARQLALDLNPAHLPARPARNPLRLFWPGKCIWGIGGRAEAIPLKTASVDLVHSNLLLPCADSAAVIGEVARILKPGGLFLFSSLGPDSFAEMRAAGADFKDFTDMHDLGDQMVQAGLSNPVLNREDVIFTYEDDLTLRGDFRHWGCEGYLQDSRPTAWQGFLESYRGELKVTLEVVFGHAWKPTPPKGLEGKRVIPIKAPR
jgi:malonyl-CoA O-methyltransferase